MKLFVSPEETIEGISRRIEARERTSVEVVEQCLQRIDELEPKLKAWVSVDRDGALRRARELDADGAVGGWHGPLHGVPVGIKDIIDVAGFPTAAGSARLAKHVARQDADLVAGLRAAGAIILGKTVTTQYACFDPPPTSNPWNPERTPGGSSSGSAAAVAVGMCPGAIGSQTGGSITRPASFCGVAGCKPTHGRISLTGVMPLAPSLDHPGPMARSVRGLALLLDATSGPGPHGAAGEPDSVYAAIDRAPLGPPRLARLGGLFRDRAEKSVQAEMARVIEVLRAAGGEVTSEVLPDEFDDVLGCHRMIMASEAAVNHAEAYRKHRSDFLPKVSELLEEGIATHAVDYARSRAHQARLSDSILGCFEGFDALIVPATVGPAPDPSTTGDPAFNSPWSYTGLPTVSLPTGLSPEGLPLAVQLVGRRDGEAELFRVAAWCEDVLRKAAPADQLAGG